MFGVRLDSLIDRDRNFLEESPLETKVPLVFYKVSDVANLNTYFHFLYYYCLHCLQAKIVHTEFQLVDQLLISTVFAKFYLCCV